MWKSHSARCNKRDRFFERRCLTWAEITAEVVAKVCAIRQIEELNEGRKVVMFLELEVLRDARVKLEKRLTAKIVKGRKLTLAGS